MIDVILLRIMKYREKYFLLDSLVQRETIDAKTVALLEDFGKYFEAFSSHNVIDLTTFMTRFPHWHKGINDERISEYARIMANVTTLDADADQNDQILKELADNAVALNIANIATRFQEGELDDDLLSTLSNAMDKYKLSRGIKQVKYIDTPISELLKDDFDDNGIKWRLSCINAAMRPLRGGDFGIIAGRPDRGKTSFIASEISYMAPQLPPERNVLWLNNEGPGKRIIPRVWQATLNYTMSEMKLHSEAGNLEKQFLDKMGRFDKVRIVDIHGLNNAQVEMIIESNNAGIVVYDMIDNIGGFGEAARNDLKLEYMYQWARERSVKYDAIGLATSQISSDGDGLRYPELPMLKDSKTGKQGACDFQLMIGSVNDPMMQASRWISLPKNKMRKPEGIADSKAGDDKGEVMFDVLRSRYKDISLVPAGV